MSVDWNANLDSSSWDGSDLKFSAVGEAGENEYIIRGHRLRDVTQRTSAEALLLNLPYLETALIKLGHGAQPGETLTLS